MSILINFWGGDGLLNITAFHLVASLGMFQFPDELDVHVRQMDFPRDSFDCKREKQFYQAYVKYFEKIFGVPNYITYDVMDFQNKICNFKDVNNVTPAKTLSEKFSGGLGDKLLGLGCSKDDMNLDIDKGIYGKPWVGEAFHSDAKLEELYNGITDTTPIVINCGGYKGGGTAATFISLENGQGKYKIVNSAGIVARTITPNKRFTVITGPSTQFKHDISLDGDEINIFNIPQKIEELREHMPNGGGPDADEVRDKISTLEKEYEKIYKISEKRDYRNLNPCYYMPRFVSRLSSDSSLDDSYNIINMKHPLAFGNEYDYDIIEDEFCPDGQDHRLHITNLLNVFSIKSIIDNKDTKFGNGDRQVLKGEICTFDTLDEGNNATVQGIFSDEKPIKRFLFLATLSMYYLYPVYFGKDNIDGEDGNIIEKFAKKVAVPKRGGFINNIKGVLFRATEDRVTFKDDTPEGKDNNKFADDMCKYIKDFSNSYITLVLNALKDIHDTSNETIIFDDDNYNIVNKMLETSKDDVSQITICNQKSLDRKTLKNYLEKIVNNGTFREGVIDTFITRYINDFPKYNWNDANPISSEEYFNKILRYTYKKIEEVI